MLTVTKLKRNKGAKPYSLPLKLKVCAIGSTQKYVTDGEKKEYTVSDWLTPLMPSREWFMTLRN